MRIVRRGVTALAAVAALAGGLIIGFEPVPASAVTPCGASGVLSSGGSTIACTYSYSGAPDTFTVPTDVKSITVDALGAAGGESGGASFDHEAGGNGARIQGTLTVTPGETLQVNVGGEGGRDGSEAGGWNGGGYGGSDATGNVPELAGGGGGASDVRFLPYALANRLLVAAGGGGGGGFGTGIGEGGSGGPPGGPGGASGADGTAGMPNTGAGPGGPGLAGQNGGTGGAGGSGTLSPDGPAGGNGSFGLGGHGGGRGVPGGGHGGGGGAGYIGGGAGGAGGSDPTHHFIGGGAGGGGGGSNYTGAATGVTVTNGYNSGNGEVVISYSLLQSTTSLSAPSAATLGFLVTLTATVTPGFPVPTGTVTFSDAANGETTTLGTESLNSSGAATYDGTLPAVGPNAITATYSGDTNYQGSSSPATDVMVRPRTACPGYTDAKWWPCGIG